MAENKIAKTEDIKAEIPGIIRQVLAAIRDKICPMPAAYVSAYLTAEHQGLTSGSYETIVFNGEIEDAAGIHNTTTGLTTITAPGTYSIKAAARVYNSGVNVRIMGIGILVNGSLVHAGTYSQGVLINGLGAGLTVAADIRLAAGDTVGIGIYCDATDAAQRIYGGATLTWMTVMMVR